MGLGLLMVPEKLALSQKLVIHLLQCRYFASNGGVEPFDMVVSVLWKSWVGHIGNIYE